MLERWLSGEGCGGWTDEECVAVLACSYQAGRQAYCRQASHLAHKRNKKGTYETANNDNASFPSGILNPATHEKSRKHAYADEAGNERVQCNDDVAEWTMRRLVCLGIAMPEEVRDWFRETVEAVASSNRSEEGVDVEVECEEGADVHCVGRKGRTWNGV